MRATQRGRDWMGRAALAFGLLWLGATAALAAPAGLEPGAPLSLVRSGDSTANQCQVGKYGQNVEFVLLDKGGASTRVHLRQLRRIAATDQKWDITPSFSSTRGQYLVYDFERTDGNTFPAAVYSWPSFDIECPDGKFKNWGLSNFKVIEVPKATAAAGAKGIRIQLRNGQVIQVPVQKEDILSIQFE